MVMFYALQGVTPEDLDVFVKEVQVRGGEPSFSDPRQAWAWLKNSRKADEDQHEGWGVGEYSSTLRYLDYIAGTEEFGEGACTFGEGACTFSDPHEDWPLNADGTGWIRGATPGIGWSEDDHDVEDRGLFYAVVAR